MASFSVRGELSGGDLSSGELSGGDLSSGELSGGDLSIGDLSGGDLSSGELSGGDLFSGELFGGELSSGELSGGDLCARLCLTPVSVIRLSWRPNHILHDSTARHAPSVGETEATWPDGGDTGAEAEVKKRTEEPF